jgi:transcriptional regulator with XRE-family HTH domain
MRLDAVAVGRRIRELRQAHGFSQRELAVDGVSYAYISRVESGSRVPSLQALIALAHELGTSAQYLALGRRRPAHCPFCGVVQSRRASESEVDGDGN